MLCSKLRDQLFVKRANRIEHVRELPTEKKSWILEFSVERPAPIIVSLMRIVSSARGV